MNEKQSWQGIHLLVFKPLMPDWYGIINRIIGRAFRALMQKSHMTDTGQAMLFCMDFNSKSRQYYHCLQNKQGKLQISQSLKRRHLKLPF